MSLRLDGRQDDETRPLNLRFEGLGRVDGSASFSFGDTSALASMSGPIEVRLAAELPSKATFEVLVRPLANVPGTESKSIASSIRGALEPSLILTKNPRSLVQLVIQALSPSTRNVWDTTLAAAMINACTLALLNASSIPMRGVVAAVAVCQTRSGLLVVDPSDEELRDAASCGCFAFIISNSVGLDEGRSDCIWSNWRMVTGGIAQTQFSDAKALTSRVADKIATEMRRCVAGEYGIDLAGFSAGDVGSRVAESDDEKMII